MVLPWGLRTGQIREVGLEASKCVQGHNHHRQRDQSINKGLVSNKLPRCNKIEGWNRIVQCEAILEMKEKFIAD